MQNKYDPVFHDTINDDVVACHKTVQAGTQVIASPADVGLTAQQPKLLGDAVGDASSDLNASALAHDIQPNAIKFGLRFPRDPKLAH